MKIFYFFLMLLLSFSLVTAQEPKPVLYGQAYNSNTPADGSLLAVYVQGNSSDNITDIVGIGGRYNVSGYWKVELNNLAIVVEDSDIIVLYLTDGENETIRLWTVDTGRRTVNLSLNYNTSFQDYDVDGYDASVDCDDNNVNINPGAAEICSNGIDDDCDEGIDEGCVADEGTTTTTGGGGGGGCFYKWNCTEWTECSSDGLQARACENIGNCPDTYNVPETIGACNYTAAATESSASASAAAACVEDWECTEWTECSSEEIQIRTCTDKNECGTSDNKPSESQGCTYEAEEIPEESEPTGLAAITGAAIANLAKQPVAVGIGVLIVIGILGYIVYRKVLK